MIEVLVTVAILAAYGLIGGVTIGFLKGMDELDEVATVIGGALWPIAMPLAIGYSISKSIRQKTVARREAKERARKEAAERAYKSPPVPESNTYRDPPEKSAA